MLSVYARLNAAHPLKVKSTITGALLGAADLTCQCAEGGDIDLARTGQMGSWGLLINGPSGHAFYAALDRIVTSHGTRSIITKIAIDQLAYTPPLTFGFFVYQGLAAGSAGAEALELARRETWPTLLYNWTFWSVAHVVTFAAIPLEHRVAWVALKNFVWSGFLSWRLSCIQQQQHSTDAWTPPDCDSPCSSGKGRLARNRTGASGATHSATLFRRYSSGSSIPDYKG